jgi:hypothetical protein
MDVDISLSIRLDWVLEDSAARLRHRGTAEAAVAM